MKKLLNIGTENTQRHTIQFEDDEITLILKFHAFVGMWSFDVTYKGKSRYGVRLAASVFHIRSENYPFDFYVIDNSGEGVDPFRIDDFEEDRCSLYMLEAVDMENLRGVSVPI